MPTDYEKLREACPALERKERDIARLAQRPIDPDFFNMLVDHAGDDEASSKALEAQPELLAKKRKADEALQQADALRDHRAADSAASASRDAVSKAMDNLRSVCKRPPGPPTS